MTTDVASDLRSGRLRSEILSPVYSTTLSFNEKADRILTLLGQIHEMTPAEQARIRKILQSDDRMTRQATLVGHVIDDIAERLESAS
jgi:hypothetical protein